MSVAPPETAVAAIAAEGVDVRYHGGPEPAVRDVSFTLRPGEGLMVSGPAGAGKTSLLRGILGLVAHRGRLEVLGGLPGGPGMLGRAGYGPQGVGFAAGLRVDETARLVACLRGGGSAEGAAALEAAGLSYVAGWRTSRLDAEGWRRLSLAVAVAGDPELVLLDDPWVLRETIAVIRAARERGAAVVVAARRPAGLAPLLGRRITLRDGVPE
ncbi:MAG: ATP-binding cassette domain-containing protein [Thermoleophilia bacterium]